MSIQQRLEEIYQRLLAHYGPQHWWPADEPLEIIVGAILTQSTAWVNVEKAISNLKEARALNPAALRQISSERLAHLIYPSGYYKVKALKLKALAKRLWEEYGDSLERMLAQDVPQLRRELLSIYGIGLETADSIILYAAQKPIFVIDAYTRRLIQRLGVSPVKGDYVALQTFFMNNLPQDEKLYNEYHALLVRHGKEACKKAPLCHCCCLSDLCPFAR